MNILQISSHDHQGGAARIAWYLFEGYKRREHQSYLAVGSKSLDDPCILTIDPVKSNRNTLNKLRKWMYARVGLENFHYPETGNIPYLPPSPPDIIHAHNLHGKYFDLRMLPTLSAKFPTILTLHDNWLMSGYCTYAVGCDRWMNGCGKCSHLSIPSNVLVDLTSYNWFRKKKIYAKSKLYLVTPSQWLWDHVQHSILMPGIEKGKVIHNGVDLAVYKPADKKLIRQELGLPENALILLYVVASGVKTNSYKDYQTIADALKLLQDKISIEQQVVFLGLGDASETEVLGNLEKRFLPYQSEIRIVAKYYQAADIYIHAARLDNFPNVILEALACGLPVVATAVGGIPEQILDGKTGSLVPAGSSKLMAEGILELLHNNKKREEFSIAAAKDARDRFSLERMIDEYLDFYKELLTDYAISGVRNS